ncbi:SNF2 helicase associated domain-containing protein [Paenalkalicoccus suaedae]|uniref:SNF2 helicase associated domain-containing protein n=1 Tax=Paenalkalicoccus suaedae TaxID=2592382 RepID=A0A859FE96_9BACI|nr:SNF2 helicase associated domain-containing protein [Paenalkalicoccus suaedae]QKS70546.1 SNF2 helicase associated domain-containing protein [Paenalkalicoccus suaedae]
MRLDELTSVEIERHFSESETENKAKALYENERVKEMLWDKELARFKVFVDDDERQTVEVEPSNELEIIHTSCTCKKEQCEHVGAVLFKMAEYKVGKWLAKKDGYGKAEPYRLPAEERSRTARLLRSLESLYVQEQESTKERQPLEVEFLLSLYPSYNERIQGGFELELKVGPKRTYVVKDIHAFLRSLSNGESIRFSKLFTFHASDYVIKEEDMHVFSLMKEVIDVKQSSYIRNQNDEERTFCIPPTYAEKLLNVLAERRTSVNDSLHEYEGLVIEDLKPIFSFRLAPLKDTLDTYEFKWDQAEKVIYLGRMLPYLFFNGICYKVTKGQQDLIESLYFHVALEDKQQLLLDRSQLDTFASILLPKLKEIGELSMDGDIEEMISMPPLKPKLMISYEGERLTADVIFQYGSEEIRPFLRETHTRENVLVRDMELEYKLLGKIEDLPFRFNGKELFLDSLPDILDFVSFDMPQLDEWFDIYAPKSIQDLIFEPYEEPKLSVSTSGGWMDVHFDVSGITDDDIDAMMRAILARDRYFKLSSGSYVPLHDEVFDPMKQLFDELQFNKNELEQSMQVPLYRALQVEDSGLYVKKSEAFQKLITRLTEPVEEDFPLPAIDADLREYQKRGYQWMTALDYYGFGGILADDMGLGKTLQTITFLLGKKERKDVSALIVSPSSVVYNWKKEIQRFAPSMTVLVVNGSAEERQELLATADDYDIVITSYPVLRRDVDIYEQKQFDVLILDEAQNVKNAGTKTARAVRKIKRQTSFALSGTPIENSLEELYSIFAIVLPGVLPRREAFNKLTETQIARRIRAFVLRRQKKEVLQELPEKIEAVEYMDMTQAQKTLYLGQLAMLRQEASSAIERNEWQDKRMQILAGLTRLRQICCHPGMFVDSYEGGSEKLDRLLDYLEEAKAAGRRVVVFSQFTTMLAIIREQLAKRDWDYFYLDGKTPSEERVQKADQFNAGEKDLFLVSLKAGGTGLNLTGGDTVILFDSWWNPAIEDQAADRVYRFGQKRVVHVTKLITTGTIEEKIHQLQDKKRDLLDRVIQPGETMVTSLGKEEIRELLDI